MTPVSDTRLFKLGEDEDTPWSPDVQSTRLQFGPLRVNLEASSRCWFYFGIDALAEFDPGTLHFVVELESHRSGRSR